MKPAWKQGLLYGAVLLSGVFLSILIQSLTAAQGAGSFLRGLFNAFQPILIGFVLAYLFYPLVSGLERRLVRQRLKRRGARTISTVVVALALFAFLLVCCYYLIPILMTNLTNMVSNVPDRLAAFSLSVEDFLQRHSPASSNFLVEVWAELTGRLEDWFRNDWPQKLEYVASGLFQLLRVFFNLCIGIIVMVYLLISRDLFIGQCKKALYALCGNRKICGAILNHLRHINRIFSGFITGKLIDSLVIGLLCWIGLRVLGVPYAILISVVVGCTNIIPVFGPFIGAIPCAFLLLLEAPTYCLIFLVFIILLQQLDGNVIGPMILGDSVGLPAFWVLFSLLFFQYLMGFWGMIIGVPLFASFYYLFSQLVKYLLRHRRLPTKTRDYVSVDVIDEEGRFFYLHRDHTGPLAGPGTVEPAPEPVLKEKKQAHHEEEDDDT